MVYSTSADLLCSVAGHDVRNGIDVLWEGMGVGGGAVWWMLSVECVCKQSVTCRGLDWMLQVGS